ncbi:MAG TPA: zf-HC2 domain-containing protein [Alphaproteobacteria bacterium]|nr:zf-HC2 domain-containing protein [Alphaproteobacteria bacterium]
MNHLSEEQIVLHYYGDAEEAAEVERHLAACPDCRAEFARVQSMLRQIEPLEVPEPAAGFEEKTWLNLRDRLPEKRGFLQRLLQGRQKWALAGVMAVLLAAAFVAGRFWPRPGQPITQQPSAQVNPQRVVLVAVGDHLERSQMLLVEIMNADAKGPINFSSEQAEARELLDSNHLYRVSSQQAGDPQVARLLDQLGRVLAEIANGPAEVSPEDLQHVRHTIQSDGLLFKVRVVGSEVNSKVRRPELSGGSVNQRL